MLNLLGKVSFDASGFTQGMSKMKAAAGPAGKEIGQQIRGKMLEAFGAGAAIALFKKTIENATKIRQGATKFGTDAATFQTMSTVADKAGASVDELFRVIEDGGPAADSLSEAMMAAQEELRNTGQLIDDETVQRLSNLGDKIDALLGRFSPLVAEIVDGLETLWEKGQKWMDRAVMGGQIAYGQIMNKPEHVQAGRNAAYESFSGTGQPENSVSAVRAAAEIAAKIASDPEKRGASGRSASARSPEVSSLVAAGAIFNRSLGADNPQQKTLDTMKNEIARIRSIIEKGGI